MVISSNPQFASLYSESAQNCLRCEGISGDNKKKWMYGVFGTLTKRKKRLQKLRQSQKNVSFTDLQQVLEDFGFKLVRSSGSHHSFSLMIDGEERLFVLPYRHPVKAVYVREALKLIDKILANQAEEETDEENAEGTEDEEN